MGRDAMARARRAAGELRERIVALLESDARPLTGRVLVTLLEEQGETAAPSLVFRALGDLVAQGTVHKLLTLRGYVPVHASDEIYLCCIECGAIGRVEAEEPFQAIAHAAAQLGFRVTRPLVEVTGHCARCARPFEDRLPDC
jgi:Fur family transcriptional regulator, zinc uptake regulator